MNEEVSPSSNTARPNSPKDNSKKPAHSVRLPKKAPDALHGNKVNALQERHPEQFEIEDKTARDMALCVVASRERMTATETWALLRAVNQSDEAPNMERVSQRTYVAGLIGEARAFFPSWWFKVQVGERGKVAANLHNALIVLKHDKDIAGRLRFNELSREATCRKMPWDKDAKERPWDENDSIYLAAWFQSKGVGLNVRSAEQAVTATAVKDSYNPVKDYLESLEWDGKPRLDDFLIDYFGAKGDAEEYLRAVGAMWMISAVARAYAPGCKVDHMIILEGEQGTTKSSGLRALVPNPAWFADELEDLTTKDAKQGLRSKWIIEASELSALKPGDRERAKAFMSKQEDRYRNTWGHFTKDYPRRCVFIGTTNDEAYLTDPTGNRRYWSVKITQVDIKAIKRDRDQLWAEAVERHKAEEPWWLTKEQEERLAKPVQEARRVPDPWEDSALDYALECMAGGEYITAGGFFESIEKDIKQQDKRDMFRVADAFKAIGLTKAKSPGGTSDARVPREKLYARSRYYVPADADDPKWWEGEPRPETADTAEQWVHEQQAS